MRPYPSFRRVFIDTSAYYALADRDERQHQLAQQLFGLLASTHRQLFTSTYIVAETHALLVNRLNSQLARTFVQRLYDSATTIVRIGKREEERGWQIVTSYTDKDFTLTDATSFVMMERLGITHAFTLDDDFSQYGFIQLTPEHL